MTPPSTTTTAILTPARRAAWKYVGGMLPVLALWVALATWLAVQLYERADWSNKVDNATMQEWLRETRTFRQPLPEMVATYARLSPQDVELKQQKRAEIETQMKAMVEPMRIFTNQLPTFPEIFSLTVEEPGVPMDQWITWRSPVPRPGNGGETSFRTAIIQPLAENPGVRLLCEYRMHPDNQLQKREEDRRQISLVAGVLLVTATLLAALFVWRFLRREHSREIERFTALAEKEHRERDLIQARLVSEEAGKAAQELHQRAIEAEKAALEVKSQIYASIGIMAGSYAHNIKNLLVRPNDLLARSLEAEGLTSHQAGVLHEIKSTLSTVTERLQQILRTVRRDPQQTQMQRLELSSLVTATVSNWNETAFEKWKLELTGTTDGPLIIFGDVSHLQQAIENLIFNARDATFEMRNLLRDEARASHDRKQGLLAAAAWKGSITLSTTASNAGPILEVRDNGIGMTNDVKARCLESYFSTKRDNALYEGYSAGMGLGLSFVAMVLEHHKARLEITTAPREGTCFRIIFPTAASLV